MRAGVWSAALFLIVLVTAMPAAATSTWASAANKVCTVWTAKAKTALTPLPKTPAEAYRWSVKSVILEKSELVALEKIPHVTPAGAHALASIRTDIAEIEVGLKDWRAGNKSGFARVFVHWLQDHRPHTAFVAAGARACG